MYRSTSALIGVEWSDSRTGRFTLEEISPSTPWTGGWMGPRAGLDVVGRRKTFALPGFELRPFASLNIN
jgi:hypothetical protein